MKFIHIADVHLGVKPDRGRTWSDERALEIEQSFYNILDICEEDEIDLLLIAGDLYHNPPTVQQLKNLDYRLGKLPKTKTVIIAGNHDYIEENSPWETYEFSSNTVLFPRDRAVNLYFEDINVCITGYSYGRQEYTERILERLRPGREGAYNIMIGHGGDKEHMPFSKEKLAEAGFDYIALGHIHKPAHLIKNKMCFSGSLEPIDYTETGRRGYIYGEVTENGTTKINWIPSNVRSYINMSIDVLPDYSNAQIRDIVENEIAKQGKENIYRIMLKGRIDNGLEINLSALTREYCINQIIDKTQYDYDINELLAGNDNNLLGRFIKTLMDENSTEDAEIRNKALRYGIEAFLGVGEE